ncbi:MAG: four helix bundle protein [Candidatus Doudnabacteria bacterium]|nr:four helix bundle protein [Candidatus Doudnabacteria bacterium]
MKLKSFKDLTVWQKAINLVDEIYKITAKFPKSETYGLASQMQRAAVAIASNIAEGYKRNHRLEFIQFLGIANSSSGELETQIVIAKRQYQNINYLRAELLLEEIQKMLHALIQSLKPLYAKR